MLRSDDIRDLILGTMMDRLEFLEKQCVPLEDSVRENAKVRMWIRLASSLLTSYDWLEVSREL